MLFLLVSCVRSFAGNDILFSFDGAVEILAASAESRACVNISLFVALHVAECFDGFNHSFGVILVAVIQPQTGLLV